MVYASQQPPAEARLRGEARSYIQTGTDKLPAPPQQASKPDRPSARHYKGGYSREMKGVLQVAEASDLGYARLVPNAGFFVWLFVCLHGSLFLYCLFPLPLLRILLRWRSIVWPPSKATLMLSINLA